MNYTNRPKIFDNQKQGWGVFVFNQTKNPKAPNWKAIYVFDEPMTFKPGDEITFVGWQKTDSLVSITRDRPMPEDYKPKVTPAGTYTNKPREVRSGGDDDIPLLS